MKKRILLLLVAMIGLATSVGWAENVITTEFFNNFPNKPTSWNKGYTFVYANGHPITITKGSDTNKVKISVDSSEEALELEISKNPVVFGGSKNGEVAASTITMTSGQVFMLLGGGYGATANSDTPAKILGTTTITMTGGTVAGSLIGGGLYYAQSKDVKINLSGDASVGGTGNWIICGGFESGVTAGTNYTQFNNTVESATLNIDGGTYAYIALGGTDGAKGKITKSTATVKDAKIIGGVFGNGSNGCSDEVSGTFTNCTFAKESNLIEIASVNRGVAKKVALTFNECTFPENPADIQVNLGATYRWGYNYNSSSSKIEGVPGEASFVFDQNCKNVPVVGVSDGLSAANVTLTGAKAKLDRFEWNKEQFHNEFTIDANKTWTFNDGLEVADGITLKSANSGNKGSIKGHIVVKGEGSTLKDLNIECNSIGYKYNEKNAISVFANKVTLEGNVFTPANNIGDAFVYNGIVFYPAATSVEYNVAGNTFSGFAKEGSTAIMIRENFKSTTQIPDIAATKSLSNGSLVDASIIEGKNTFTNVAGLYYCRLTGNYSGKDAGINEDETITQQHLYTYTKGSLKDAFDYSKAFSKIQFDGTSDELLTAINIFDSKDKLKESITVICSDETIYTDEATALANGGKYIKLESNYSLAIAKKKEAIATTIATSPTASEIEVGQLLSASILKGGKATATVSENDIEVSGTFAWKEPNTTVSETGNFDIIFTPSDTTSYKSVTAKVAVTAKQYFTVKVGKSENGTVAITGEKESGRYIKDTTLAIVATPNEHYKFTKWDYEEGKTDASTTLNVDKDYVLTATFVPEEYTITIGDKITVLNGDKAVSNSGNVTFGTVLSVVANPADTEVLESLTCNGKPVTDGKVVVTGVLDIKATFGTKEQSTYLVKAGEMKNGKVLLFDMNGNPIEYGSAHIANTEINMLVVPDYGYELNREDGDSLTVAGTEVSFTAGSKSFEIGTGDVTVAAKFKLKKFTVTNSPENATVTLNNTNSPVDFGTEITVSSAKASAGYKLLAVTVNGKEVAVNGSFKVVADTKINAVVKELPEVTFTDTKQEYTYNGQPQPFIIRTTPAGIGNITLKYQMIEANSKSETAPTDVGEYYVYASMGATGNYKELTDNKIGTLKIKKALYTNVAIPTKDVVQEDNTNVSENNYYWNGEADNNFRNAFFQLEAGLARNYENPEFNIPAVDVSELTEATIDNKGWSFRSTSTLVSLSLSATNGSVSIWNGSTQVTSTTKVYVGQTLTLKAIPNAGYSKTPTWSGDGVTGEGEEVTLVIPVNGTTVVAEFAKKQMPKFITKDYTSDYDGTVFGTAVAPVIESSVTGWTLSFKQHENVVAEPIETGVYDIYASRPADDNYEAVIDAKVGKLTIGNVAATVSDVVGSDITTAQVLNESVITGVANVDGKFEWVNGGEKLSAGIHDNLSVKFTPTDKNYSAITINNAKVIVTAPAGDVTVRTLTLKVNGEENGDAVVMTLNGITAQAGDKVKTGDKLKVEFSAHAGYEASATINRESYSKGQEYVIKDTEDVAVVVSYTKISVTPPPSTTVSVESVSLNKSTLTLPRKESYTLQATINPSDATNKNVTWASSDDKIATVDASGKVTAVAVGKATITVTTADGAKTASCVVTVDFATGLEEVIANTRVYGQDHTICIEPAMPIHVMVVGMNGQLIYNDLVTSATQIPVASTGVYVVKLGTGDTTSVRKISVK